MRKPELPISEDLDFSYLLGLMRPLHDIDGYAWLPELFTLIGHENLLKLCKYAGGESITIPTLDELFSDIEALQYFYDVYIKHKICIDDVPITSEDKVNQIKEIYFARQNET